MTQEEKQLLLTDLCGRLPHGVIYHTNDGSNNLLRELNVEDGIANWTDEVEKMDIRPYLRPMGSMTKREKEEIGKLAGGKFEFGSLNEITNATLYKGNPSEWHIGGWELVSHIDFLAVLSWLNARHFDYRGLIEKGLAIEVTEDNNPYKKGKR